MKLFVPFALFALVAARVDFGGYEPIDVGPALVDLEPETTIGSIDRETLIALLRRLLERLANLRPKDIHIGAEPVNIYEPVQIGPALVDDFEAEPSITSLEDLIDWLHRTMYRIWPDGIPRPPRPSLNTIDSIKELLRQLINCIWPDGVHRPPRPTWNSIEELKNWIREIIKLLEGEPVGVPPKPKPEAVPSPTPNPTPSSPLVQIIVNVKNAASGPVQSPVIVDKPEEAPTPVNVIDDAEEIFEEIVDVTPVLIANEPEQINVVDEIHMQPEPVIVAPSIVAPVVAPDVLN